MMSSPLRSLLLAALAMVCAAAATAQPLTLSREEVKPGDSPIDRPAIAYEWLAPALPAGGLPGGSEAQVSVRFTVDARGAVTDARVTDSPDPSLNDAAIAAIRTWKFRPALEQGKPYAMSMDGRIVFSTSKRLYAKPSPPVEPSPAPRTEAQPKEEPNGDSPQVLVDRKLTGKVIFGCTIDGDGNVTKPQFLAATHRDFVPAAIEALKAWKFEPASQGDIKVPSTIRAAMAFTDIDANRQATLAANHITGSDGQPPAMAPQIEYLADPVFPADLLLKGVSGEAVVVFVVQPNGLVGETEVRSASDLRFGDALRAAVATWVFSPAIKDGQTVAVTLAVRQVFEAVPADAKEGDDPAVNVVVEARAGKLTSAHGLDRPLAPVYRVAPLYPPALRLSGKPAGSALVSMVICSDGYVRLARAVSATHPEFGISAVEAIGQWLFEPPMRGGKPVSVQVEIPVKFAPP